MFTDEVIELVELQERFMKYDEYCIGGRNLIRLQTAEENKEMIDTWTKYKKEYETKRTEVMAVFECIKFSKEEGKGVCAIVRYDDRDWVVGFSYEIFLIKPLASSDELEKLVLMSKLRGEKVKV